MHWRIWRNCLIDLYLELNILINFCQPGGSWSSIRSPSVCWWLQCSSDDTAVVVFLWGWVSQLSKEPQILFLNTRISNIETRRVLESNATVGVDDAFNAWMLQLGRYHAMRLWLGGGPWEVKRRTGSCGGVKLQSTPVSLMYSTDCCHPKLITPCGCNCPKMNSPSRTLADRLGRVYSLANLNWLQMQCW